MKLYNALVKKNSQGDIEDLILVKEGYSFWAFCFSFGWFLYHKMWKSSLLLVAIGGVISNIDSIYFLQSLNGSPKLIMTIFFNLAISINANYWLSSHLQDRGYYFAGTAFAKSPIEAKIRFTEKYQFKGGYKIDQSSTNILKHIKQLPMISGLLPKSS